MKEQRCTSKKFQPHHQNGRREERQDQAHERMLARIDRTPHEQLALLDRRLGKGKGAVNERKRLNAIITKEANK